MGAPAEDRKYTLADLLSMPNDAPRYELIDGELRTMPSPSDFHQAVLDELATQFRVYLRGKYCLGRQAPYGVSLFVSPDDSPTETKLTVLPDYSVICDRSKITEHGCMGAPDLVVEVVSPNTAGYDKSEKMDLYEAAGVREYWLLDPAKKRLTVWLLEDGVFKNCTVYIGPVKVPVSVLDNLEIDLDLVFDPDRIF